VDELATHTTDTLQGIDKGHDVTVCGIITTINRRRNKEGKLWASMQLEDWAGSSEALCFASKYEHLEKEIVDDRAVLVRAKALPEDDGSVKLSSESFRWSGACVSVHDLGSRPSTTTDRTRR
jgi:DNA polymerase-3 subunit alpha